jgi:hypothetical protein
MTTIQDIREKYPQYKDVSDEELAKGFHDKFYSDMSFEDFSSKIGLKTKPTGISPMAETGGTEEGGKAAIMYPTGKRRPVAQESITPTKIAETVFGKGTPQEAPIEERLGKVAETTGIVGAGAIGLKALAPSMISGGEAMMAKAPGLPLKAVGGALAAGGALAQRMGPREIASVAGSAGAGETLEQMLSQIGAPREFQVLGGGLGVGIGQLALEYPGIIADYLVKGVRGTVPNLIRGLGIEIQSTAEKNASKLRTEANQKAKDEILAGDTKGAATTLETGLKGGIAERQKAIEADRILAQSAAQSEILKRQKLLQQQQATVAKPIAKAPDEETFAGQLQGEIFATQKPLVEQRATQYSQLLDDATASAQAKQAEGNFWQTSEEGQSVKSYWQDKIAKRELPTAEANKVEKLLKDIYGDAQTPPLDIKGVDVLIRQLGERGKYGAEVSGAEGIDKTLAQDLRRTITKGIGERGKETGGIYSWEPKFGQAKGLYSEQSDLLKAWETKTGRKTLGEETKPLEIPKQYFSSRAGYDDLVSQLGGNKAKAAEYGRQYAQLKTQDLTTPKELNKWLSDSKNGWVDNVPGLRQQIEKKAIAAEQSEKLAKQIPVLESNLKQWNTSVDNKVKNLYSDIMGDEKPGFAIQRMITGKTLSESERRALSTYIGANPEARKLVPSVVRDILTDEQQSPKTVVKLFDERIAPMLVQTRLVSQNEIANLRQQALKLYETDAKDYSIPENKKTIKAINFLYATLAQRAGSGAAQMIPTGE